LGGYIVEPWNSSVEGDAKYTLRFSTQQKL